MNEVYTECATNCPRTCENHFLVNVASDACKTDCSPGCICRDGFFRDIAHQNICKRVEDCSCTYRGKLYQTKEKVNVDCNTW